MEEKKSKFKDNFITVVIIIFSLYCIVGVLSSKNSGELFYIMGYKPVVVLSGSMEPYMETNSIVIVEKTKDVGINDAIFFMQDGKVPIIHRVVRFDENGNIITKGDANDTEDFIPVTINSVEGKVVLVLNWLSPIVDLFL